jgi:hypothetical protein
MQFQNGSVLISTAQPLCPREIAQASVKEPRCRLCIDREKGGTNLMKTLVLGVPEFGFILGTRAALAAGVGLLIGRALTDERRRAIGAALVAVGVATTIPAGMALVRGLRRSRRRDAEKGIAYDERLIGATRFPRKGDDDWS